jgi:transposase
MTTNLSIKTERVDDIPVLLTQAEKIDVAGLLDSHFIPHANWQGTSLGWTATIWLTHILSEGDHRLNHVQAWAAKRLDTLRICTDQPVREQEWSDDRLGIVLDALSDDEHWQEFEQALNRHTVRVYKLKPKQVRVDSTSASGYGTVSEEGLLQFGHSKDHRPDLPQVKVMISALDPLGMPIATQVVSGERADDPLYVPAIQQVQASLGEHDLLYVGDCKMAALKTRAFIHAQEDYYLCPLPEKQLPPETLESYLKPVWHGEQQTVGVYRADAEGQPEQIAEGYERNVLLQAEHDGQRIAWSERHLIIRSLQQARASEEALRTRLTKAQVEVEQLNERKQGKRRIVDREGMQAAVTAIVKRHRVDGLIHVTVEEQVTERAVRAYGDRPERVETERELSVQIERDEQAVEEVVRRFGWRVYATNQPRESLSLEQAVLAYRAQYRIERGFERLKDHPLSLTPMYLQSDARATGLIRLLSIGLRMLTLIEYQVRQRLVAEEGEVTGLYAGNPKRATTHPTTEAMLKAFKGIDLSTVTMGPQTLYHVTPLTALHQQILCLLDFPVDIYTRLCDQFPKLAGKMAEP